MASTVERLFDHPRHLALLCGVIFAFAFAPIGAWLPGLIVLAALTELVARAPGPRRAFVYGWLFGMGSFTIGLNWIVTAFGYQAEMPAWLGWIAVAGLSAYLAVWPGLAAAAARLIAGTNRLALVFAMAGCWALGEWLRGWVFTGFPWNPLGAITLRSQANPGLAITAQWIGTYGLSALVMLLGGSLLLAWHRRGRDWQTALLALGPVALMMMPAPIFQRLPGHLAYTLVQPDARQEDLHDPNRYEALFQRAMQLSQAKQPGQTRLVLWPESGLPDYLHPGYPQAYYAATTYGGDPAMARARIGRLIGEGSLLLTGNDQLEVRDGKVVGARAGIAAIDASGTIRATYAKAHLVPYGEYVPLKPVLEPLGLARFVPGDIEFWPGPGPRTLDFGAHGKVGMQLCYEIIFPGQVTEPGKRPDFIFNPSNDGWYGDWGPPQHLAQARLRAVEEGLPVLRSTTTGISAVIDADGVVRERIGLLKAERRDGLVPPAKSPTLFARWGNSASLVWAMALLALSLVARRRLRG